MFLVLNCNLNYASLNFMLLVKSHLGSYPTPLQINTFWNFGFLLGITIVIQIITGIFLTIHYSSDMSNSFMSLYFLSREVYYGGLLRYFHANGASFVFLFAFLHLARSLYYSSYFYNPNTFITGIIIFLMLMAIAFIGYVLPFGQMSFWGATVITNLMTPFPVVIEYLLGGFTVSNPTIKRFFIFHFILPFVMLAIVILHLFYLHYMSSNNPLRINTNNKIPFFPYLVLKDTFSLFLVFTLMGFQSFFGVLTLSHPDNSLEANPLVTPLHIVPEWYFLIQYAMLKAIPNKNSGFIILVTSITILFLLTESKHMTTMVTINHSNLSINYFFLTCLLLLYIGAQYPTVTYIFFARILTVFYYLFIFSILLTHSSTCLSMLYYLSFSIGDLIVWFPGIFLMEFLRTIVYDYILQLILRHQIVSARFSF